MYDKRKLIGFFILFFILGTWVIPFIWGWAIGLSGLKGWSFSAFSPMAIFLSFIGAIILARIKSRK